MKRIYEPEAWSILKIESKEQQPEYLVFGIWFGSFATPAAGVLVQALRVSLEH